ncbi:MAG: DNA repair exonuclease [Actinomycetota bacterium]
MSFCFIHAADLHLDTPFQGIGQVTPWVADALRDASLEAFDALVELALNRNAAFVVFAGDIYDGAERGVRAQLRFKRGLERLSDAGIWSFVVHGNHDPIATGWSVIRSDWPELVKIFGSEIVDAVTVEKDGEPICERRLKRTAVAGRKRQHLGRMLAGS